MSSRLRHMAPAACLVLLTSAANAQSGWDQSGKLVPAEGYGSSDNHFAYATSLHGNWALVGSPPREEGQGYAYLFEYRGTAAGWHQVHRLYPSAPQPGEDFGRSVSLSHGVVIVGAPEYENGSGIAYVFEDPSGEWGSIGETTLHSPAYQAGFGRSVAIVEDTALVGAPGLGSVFVFERSSGIWTLTAELAQGLAGFGCAVSFDGVTAVVGNPADGEAVVFVRSGGSWAETGRLVASSPTSGEFGSAVGIRGSRLVVGAPDEENQGSVHVFELDEDLGWTGTAIITGSDLSPVVRFGSSLALDEDSILVGAPGDDMVKGTAHLFERLDTFWVETVRMRPDVPPGEGTFGLSVALAGDVALVNVGLDDTPILGVYAGAANVWRRGSILRDPRWSRWNPDRPR